jgi:predicted flap endonuclease-1-like 5' DNA nuclease
MSIYAVVKRKNRESKGKGFSRSELKEVYLSTSEALKLSIPIDTRRSTKHEKNVQTLRVYIKSMNREPFLTKKAVKTIKLTEVKGIGPKTMEKLVKAGIKSANELAVTDVERVAKVIGASLDRALTLIDNASSLLNQTDV